MSENKGTKKAPLQNAGEIIERFGGIRPMAAKIDTPVTTVQGWKKRDVIPATRRADILSAAKENNIDLTDIADAVASSVANENKSVRAKSAAKSKTQASKKVAPKITSTENKAMDQLEQTDAIYKVEEAKTPEVKGTHTVNVDDNDLSTVEHDAIMKAISDNSRKNAVQTVWIVTILLLVAAAVAAFLLWPSAKKINNLENDINTLASEVDDVNDKTSLMDGVTTDKMKQRMDGLQNQARNIQSAVEQLATEAKSVGQVALGEEGINLSSRISVLEEKLKGFDGLDALMSRIQVLESTVPGQEQLAKSVDELRGVVQSGGTRITDGVERAKDAKTALGETMGGVSGNEMKAAAMLLTLSQMRRSLDREQPFSDDLALVQKLAGQDNDELQGAIEKLAPYADSGVLSIGGLAGEFKGLAGEAVAASIAGEDLSLKDKAKARFNNVIQLEKDGKLLTGTETQAIIHNAEKYLNTGDAEKAIAELKKLDGKTAEQVQPFIQRAELSLLAKRVQDLAAADVLTNQISTDAGGLERTQRDTEINLNEVEDILNESTSDIPSPVGNEGVLPKSDFKGFSARQ